MVPGVPGPEKHCEGNTKCGQCKTAWLRVADRKKSAGWGSLVDTSGLVCNLPPFFSGVLVIFVFFWLPRRLQPGHFVPGQFGLGCMFKSFNTLKLAKHGVCFCEGAPPNLWFSFWFPLKPTNTGHPYKKGRPTLTRIKHRILELAPPPPPPHPLSLL